MGIILCTGKKWKLLYLQEVFGPLEGPFEVDGRLSNEICPTWVGLTTAFILSFGSSFAMDINIQTTVPSSQCS